MRGMRNSLMIALLILSVLACGDDEPAIPSAQEEAFERLAGEWTMGTSGSIVLDDVDISANYNGFSLSFTDGGYATNNAGGLFGATGTWEWANEEAGQIIVDGTQTVNIVSLTETRFNFTFAFAGSSGAIAGAAGNYNITLQK